MKKLLITFKVGILILILVFLSIGCNKNDDWNNIIVDQPLLPIKIVGFNDIDFKTINPQNNQQTIPSLLEQLKQLFKGKKWKFNKLIKNYKFNNQTKSIDNIDLYRNGKYELNFNDSTNLNKIKINKTVITSNHIADIITSTDLGQIDDIRPKTILIAIIFNNMHIISELDKFGEFFIGDQTSEIWNRQINFVNNINVNKEQTGAILKTEKDYWSEYDNTTKDYYGIVNVQFSVTNQLTPPLKKEDLGMMNLITNLEKLSKVTILQIIMAFISFNFVGQLNRLSVFLNDFYIEINSDKNKGIITVYDKSQYYCGSVIIIFS